MGDEQGIGTTLVLLAAREGDPRDAAAVTPPAAERVIAADSGLHLATALGLRVDLVIGDLDSVDPALLEQALAAGVDTDVHPRDKDHTDLVLALHEAAATDPDEIVVIGGAGGRLDHGLANLMALADPHLAPARVSAWLGGAHVDVVRDVAVRLDGRPGQVVSLLPVGGPADGVHTTGLRWELKDAHLDVLDTRGVSNEFVDTHASVRVDSGCLLAIRPADEAAEGSPPGQDPPTPR